MDNLNKYLPALYDDMQNYIRLFKRESYQDTFEAYCMKNQEAFKRIHCLIAEADSAKEEMMQQIAEAVCDCAAGLLEREKGKRARENMQINMNMMTVLYLIPAVRRGGSDEEELTEMICSCWNKRFQGSRIKPSDFQSIQDGFRSKLCYITTAVCKSLHKPESCYELAVLKQYRDGYLAETEEGPELIRNYYDIAPTIVNRIEKSKDADQVYRMIWEQYLQPCIELIESAQNEACGRLYREMVERLHKQYMEEYHV